MTKRKVIVKLNQSQGFPLISKYIFGLLLRKKNEEIIRIYKETAVTEIVLLFSSMPHRLGVFLLRFVIDPASEQDDLLLKKCTLLFASLPVNHVFGCCVMMSMTRQLDPNKNEL